MSKNIKFDEKLILIDYNDLYDREDLGFVCKGLKRYFKCNGCVTQESIIQLKVDEKKFHKYYDLAMESVFFNEDKIKPCNSVDSCKFL